MLKSKYHGIINEGGIVYMKEKAAQQSGGPARPLAIHEYDLSEAQANAFAQQLGQGAPKPGGIH